MLTIKELRALKPGEWRTDGGARGAGTLVFHASTSGKISAYFRHAVLPGKRYDLPLGLFDESGRMGSTLVDLRARAGELSKLYQAGLKDLRAHLESQENAARAAEEAALATKNRAIAEQQALREEAERKAREKELYTIGRLCECYTNHLKKNGKVQSAKHAHSIFTVHLLNSDKELANQPANEVDQRDIATLIRKVRESGKERAAGILRSYLSAAFSLAANAEHDTSAPAELIDFRIDTNPVLGIKAIPVGKGQRTLSNKEIALYMKNLDSNMLIDRTLLLHLYIAGQRISQLLRVRCNDYDPGSKTLRLWDPKGRRSEPREHLLPLASNSAEIVSNLVIQSRNKANSKTNGDKADPNPPLFLSINGKPLSDSTPGHRVQEIVKAMGVEPFDLRDIRRTCETQLAVMGINRDIRGQLLSHGISGVQATHYDRHDYRNEKADALIRWEQYLEDLHSTTEANG